MGCSPPGSSVHGILQVRILEWVAISFSRGIFPTQELNPGLSYCRGILYHLSNQGSPLSKEYIFTQMKSSWIILSSVQFSHSVVSNSSQPHESQHAKPPCPSPTPGGYSNSCPSSRWCHPAISSSVIPFSSCPQSFPASGSFLMSQLFAWGSQSIGVSASASVLSMNIQDWSPSGWTGWISL